VKKLALAFLVAFTASTHNAAFAQNQVKWDLSLAPAAASPGSKVLARMRGQIDPDWHIYSMSAAGAIPTTIELDPSPVVESFRVLEPAPKRAFDSVANAETETYEREVTFLVELQLKKDAPPGPAELTVTARYQTCNDKKCIPPVRRSATATLKVDPAAPATALTIPSGYAEPSASKPGTVSAAGSSDQGWWGFLAVAFGFGLATIFTPCVFPMIPITVSYFLNQQGSAAAATGKRSGAVSQAVVFCLGIIVLFSGLGLAATAIMGPAGVAQLGANPWVNGFISALFIAFGLSLLGAFEITIPSSILTRLNRSSEKGGFAGTLLMGLTFSLASFACVGPFVGTLLAASVGGSLARPVAGMVTFAAGLALPFFLLALFPSYLQRLPRSGGWLARVKVVMGFVILAASLKYLASMDQVLGWGILTRERFLAAWIVLTAMAGLYLLGFLRLEGIKPDDRMGLGRLLTGMAFLVLSLSFVPGMLGGRLGFWDAYVPAADSGSPGPLSSSGAGTGLVWLKNQYREALGQARQEGKLVFVNFTGYACANCHWMEANMLPRPEIAGVLKNFVLVELYTDGTDQESQKNVEFENAKFHTIASPFYAILDANENVIATFPDRTTDPKEYLAFLEKGVAAPSAALQSAAKAASSDALPRVNTLNGSPFDTAALSGKVVVVDFWATWCVPCVGEIPGFNKIHREYGPKGVAVLGVSMDEEGAARVQPFLKQHPMEYSVALGPMALFEQFRLDELPVTVIFDRSGKLVKRFDGFTNEQELEAAVRAVL
jgi:thiol:disulfide interchange protein